MQVLIGLNSVLYQSADARSNGVTPSINMICTMADHFQDFSLEVFSHFFFPFFYPQVFHEQTSSWLQLIQNNL